MTGSTLQARQFDFRQVLLPLCLVVLTVCALHPVVFNDFVNWDDGANFVENISFRGLAPANLRWMFTARLLSVYQPLSWMVCGVIYVFFGMDPFGYHLAALAFHCANVLAFYALTRMLVALSMRSSGNEGESSLPVSVCAAAGAALFAVSPLRVEVVAWASALPYLPAAFFLLLTVIVYVRSRREENVAGGWWLYGLALAFYACSLLSKAIGVTLPAVLLALDLYPLRRLELSPRTWLSKRTVKVCLEKVPFFCLSAACAGAAMWAQRASVQPQDVVEYGSFERIGAAFYGIAFHICKSLYPMRLLPWYPRPADMSPMYLAFMASAVFAVGLTLWLLVLGRRGLPGLAAWASYLAFIFPFIGVIGHGDQLGADRYTYLSFLPWTVLGVGVLVTLRRKWANRMGRLRAVGIAVGLVCLAFMVSSWGQAQVWRNSRVLWEYTTGKDPGNYIAWNNLGTYYERIRGEPEKALQYYPKALEANPRYYESFYNSGVAYGKLGQHEKAVEWYRKGLQIRPRDFKAHTNLGNTYHKMGQPGLALESYGKALELNARNERALYGAGVVCFELGRRERALRYYMKALDLNPLNVWVLNNAGVVLSAMGQQRRAEEFFRRVDALAPNFRRDYTNSDGTARDE